MVRTEVAQIGAKDGIAAEGTACAVGRPARSRVTVGAGATESQEMVRTEVAQIGAKEGLRSERDSRRRAHEVGALPLAERERMIEGKTRGGGGTRGIGVGAAVGALQG